MDEPSSFEILEALRAHPEKYADMAAQTYQMADLTLHPWDDYAGTPGHELWERLTAGEDTDSWTRASVYKETPQSITWKWSVFESNPPDDDWPEIKKGSGCDSPREAMAECDRWLLNEGYYLLEPKCDLTPEDIGSIYGGSYTPGKSDTPGTRRGVKVIKIIDGFLADIADRWANASEPNDLFDLPGAPGDVSINDLVEELLRRTYP